MLRYKNSNQIHPDTCQCRGCNKTKKEAFKEAKRGLLLFYGFSILIIVMGILI